MAPLVGDDTGKVPGPSFSLAANEQIALDPFCCVLIYHFPTPKLLTPPYTHTQLESLEQKN